MLTGNLAPSAGSVKICGVDMIENPKEAKALIGKLPPEEYIVRYLMKTQAGDPEIKGGSMDLKQRGEANMLFEHSPQDIERLNQLQGMAQQLINRRHPMGPN